jgi:prepilin-type N-terminal cleavage/methylation domain-containing protein
MRATFLRSYRVGRAIPKGPPAAAFSLLEMMAVLALLLIFASFALPAYQTIARRACPPPHPPPSLQETSRIPGTHIMIRAEIEGRSDALERAIVGSLQTRERRTEV